MKKSLKIIFIICLVIGIAATALNLVAGAQAGKLADVEAQQAARKQALAQLEMADFLGIDPATIVVPDEVTITSTDEFFMNLSKSAPMIWVVAIDAFIIGIGGFAYTAFKQKKKAQGGVKKLGSSGSVVGILIALAALCLDLLEE